MVREKEGYLVRETKLQEVIKDIQKDVEGIFRELQDVAREIDERFG